VSRANEPHDFLGLAQGANALAEIDALAWRVMTYVSDARLCPRMSLTVLSGKAAASISSPWVLPHYTLHHVARNFSSAAAMSASVGAP
jgi:hypothetical protein